MDVATFLDSAQMTVDGAMAELRKKAPDYAPDDVMFVQIVEQCAEGDIARPEVLLWALMSKHTTALRRWVRTGDLKSETLSNRVFDTINFASIMLIWASQSHAILASVATHVRGLPCDCHDLGLGNDQCTRCLVLDWYVRHHPDSLMVST